MKQGILLYVLLLFTGSSLQAQRDSSARHISHDNSLRITYENDYFTQTDFYYTQGIHVESVNPAYRYSPFMWLLPELAHSTTQYGLLAVQDCFTPTNISISTIQYGDRPYAGYIYLGQLKTSADAYKNQLLTAELDIGETGNCSECEAEQKFIHSYGNNVQPEGWQYQIGTGILADYTLRWEKALYTDTSIDLAAIGQTTIGTIYDNALAGVTLHAGKMQSYFSGHHSTLFQLYGTIQAWVEGVAYNGTMQGALFAAVSPYRVSRKQLTPVVFGDSYGITLSYHKVAVNYSIIHITNELSTGVYHGWGHLDIAFYF
jgi:lipid A 3-O-deacylase